MLATIIRPNVLLAALPLVLILAMPPNLLVATLPLAAAAVPMEKITWQQSRALLLYDEPFNGLSSQGLELFCSTMIPSAASRINIFSYPLDAPLPLFTHTSRINVRAILSF